jgi:toxin ParE1/3/4
MTRFVLTRKAVSDLRQIAAFTEQRWGRNQRNTYIGQLDAAFQRLADNPLQGKRCDDIRLGYRKFAQGSHVIFYRQSPDGLTEIVRILHRGMDADLQL